jgi:hypothetical protein
MKKLFFIGLMVCLCVACEQPTKTITGDDGKEYTVVDDVKSVSKITDYGNGVYYFDYVGKEFARHLSDFIGQNPSLELVAMMGNADGMYGRNYGYFVVFREKKTE